MKDRNDIPDSRTDSFQEDVKLNLNRRAAETLSKMSQLMIEMTTDLFFQDEQVEFEPDIDLFEIDDVLVLEAVAPGIEADDTELKISSEEVFIRGEVLASDDYDDVDAFISERFYGVFSRTIQLPYKIIPEEAEAFYRDGVLRIEMPIDEEEEDYPPVDVTIKKASL